jgi:hypothetical protein
MLLGALSCGGGSSAFTLSTEHLLSFVGAVDLEVPESKIDIARPFGAINTTASRKYHG